LYLTHIWKAKATTASALATQSVDATKSVFIFDMVGLLNLKLRGVHHKIFSS